MNQWQPMIRKYYEIRCDTPGCNAFDHFGTSSERAAIARAKDEGWQISRTAAKCPKCAPKKAAPAGSEESEAE